MKKKLLIIVAIVLVALGASAFVMFKFVLNNGDATEKPKEVKQEKPVPKAYLELEPFQDMPINPSGTQRAIVQLSLLFEYPAEDKNLPVAIEAILPLLKADISLYLESQTLEDYGVDNRQMLEEQLRVLVNNHLEDPAKGLTSVRVSRIVTQYM